MPAQFDIPPTVEDREAAVELQTMLVDLVEVARTLEEQRWMLQAQRATP